MHEYNDDVFAFCQYCKEKRQMKDGKVTKKGKNMVMYGWCLICRRAMQLLVSKKKK